MHHQLRHVVYIEGFLASKRLRCYFPQNQSLWVVSHSFDLFSLIIVHRTWETKGQSMSWCGGPSATLNILDQMQPWRNVLRSIHCIFRCHSIQPRILGVLYSRRTENLSRNVSVKPKYRTYYYPTLYMLEYPISKPKPCMRRP
jgi:hypothetical protein